VESLTLQLLGFHRKLGILGCISLPVDQLSGDHSGGLQVATKNAPGTFQLSLVSAVASLSRPVLFLTFIFGAYDAFVF